MSESDLRSDIEHFVQPGSMTIETIVDGLEEDYPRREVKVELSSMITDDELEEHPEIEGVYRISG